MKKNYFFKSVMLLAVMLVSCFGNISAQTWQLVDISELTADDVFVIVDSNSTDKCYALPNNASSSNPSVILITVSADQITGEVTDELKWNVSGNNTDGYVFYPNGDTDNWLYCNSDGVQTLRVGNSLTNNTFSYDEERQLLKNIGISRYFGVFTSNTNVTSWRCYKVGNLSNISNSHIRFYKLMGMTPSAVSTPTFSPAGGTYYEPQTVTISCATDGATIFYTTDGSRPDGNSSVYETPITVSTTTTLKAIAVLGMDTSNVATATYTLPVEVANIAELRSQSTGSTLYRLTGEAVVSFTGNYRHHKYIQDATAGILIDDNSGIITSEYSAGDGMTGLIGTLTIYHNMLEFVPTTDPGEASSHDNLLTPADIDLDADFESYEAQLVALSNVTVGAEGTFAANTDYSIVGSENVNIRLRYAESSLVGTEIPSVPQNITALVYQYDGTYNLVPISFEPYVPAPTDCENVPSMGTCSAGLDNRDMLFTGQIAVDDPLCTLNRYGFVYSTTNTTPELDGDGCETVVIGTSIEAGTPFTHRIAELGYATYYVRAFATNGEGTGYSTVASVQQAEPEIYKVAFRVNGHEGWTRAADTAYIPEGDAVKFPWMEDCGSLTFAGWALQPFEGQTADIPTLYNTFVPVSDTTFYAVFSNIQNMTNDEIVISRSSFAEGALAYNTDDEWTAVSTVAGTEITGLCDLYTNNATMQMRSDRGSLPYNVTPIPGTITRMEIYANESSSTRQWTPYLSTSPLTKANYQTTGIALETESLAAASSVTWDVDASLNATYFYLSMASGAVFIDSIVVAYTSGDALYTMSAVDTVTINQTICEGLTYEDDHFSTGEEGTHTYLQTNGDYCATQYILDLSIEARDTIRHYVDTCDIFVLDDETYGESRQVFLVTPSTEPYGCPVVDEWNITIRHFSEGDTSAIVCNSFDWHGQHLTESGDFVDTLVNAEGCDSIITLHLTINASDSVEFTETSCESYTWNDAVYEESGDYVKTFTNINGCDSVVTLHLTINSVDHTEFAEIVCGNYVWNDSVYVESGDYVQTLVNANGCDSVVTLHLTVNQGIYTEVTVDTCGIEFYWEFADTTITHSGNYYHYSTNVNTCMDTTVLLLSLYPPAMTEISAQICEGETYNQNGFNVSTAGDHQLDLQTVNGCDSTVILHLTVGSEAITYLTASVCEGDNYNENGFEITAPTAGVHEYSRTIERPGTCDSIVNLTLTVNTATEGDTAAVACGSFDWHGQHLTASGNYTDVLTNAAGCDSTVTLHLTINLATEGDTTAVACGSFDWHGQHLTASGNYTDVLTNAAGCDSTVTLHLTINLATEGDTTAVACGSFDWHGQHLTASGSYTDVLTNAVGCDSTVTLHLTINLATEGDTTAVACGSFDWHGQHLTASGSYTDVLTNAVGCDSTVTLHLTINTATEGDTTAVACGSFDWHGQHLTASGSYTDVLTNAVGCDSTVTLHLTINLATEGDTTAVACGSFDWHGQHLTASGNYTDVLTNAVGCDSTVTLHLTINLATEGDTTAVACGSFDWHGQHLTASGNYTDVLTNAVGCDSTVTLHLTINLATEGDTTAVACGSFDWHGQHLTASGNYTDVLTNAAGCDSTVTLYLTINTATEGDTTAVACGSFDWHGQQLTASGNYTDVLTNAAGCDSTVTLHLTINVADTTEFTETACGSYVWNNEVYEESGDYVQTFTNANGCDSVVTLHLTIITINTEVVVTTTPEEDVWSLEVMQENAEYQWIDCETNEAIEGELHQSFSPAISGQYACVITMGECTDTTDCIDVTISGIADYTDGIFAIFPNPTNGIVTLQLTPETCLLTPEIQIFDIYGKRLQVVSVSNEMTQIDLSTYSTGVYFVKLVSNGKVIGVRKVVRR